MIVAQVNSANFTAKLQRLLQTIDLEQANREVSIQLYGWVIRNFNTQGSLIGGWAPLKPATIKAKAKSGYTQMLVRSGALRQSFTPFYDKQVAGVGASVAKFRDGRGDYARYLEEGTKFMPARHMLPDEKNMKQISMNIYGRHVKGAIQQSGLA